MNFNLPADFTKKMLWGLLPFTTCVMVLSQRANLARSNIAGRYYMRLVLPVVALLVFMGSAGAQSLPEPLGAADVIQYKRLIELQKNGKMKQAIREMGRLKDPVLKGHLLAQRYLHPTAWRSSYKELSSWLAARRQASWIIPYSLSAMRLDEDIAASANGLLKPDLSIGPFREWPVSFCRFSAIQ